MVGNEIEGHARFVVFVVEEIFEVVGLDRRGQSQAHELCVRLNFLHGEYDLIVEPGVRLDINVMLEFDFVQDLPVRDRVVIAGLMAFAELVGEPAFRVPRQQPGVIIGNLLHAGIAQLGSFFVFPGDLVRVGGVGHRLIGLVHPLGNGTEVENHRVTFGGFEKIDGHRINHGEIPRGFAIFGRF